MTIPSEITAEDILDSRDIIARIDWLGPKEDCDPDDLEELEALLDLQDQAQYVDDWIHGEALIADDYFTEYSKDIIEGCYDDITSERTGWPYCHVTVDWKAAAEHLKVDYMDLTFMGKDYWIRSV